MSTPIGATPGGPPYVLKQELPPPPDLGIVWLPWEHNQWAINSLGNFREQHLSSMGERGGEEGREGGRRGGREGELQWTMGGL